MLDVFIEKYRWFIFAGLVMIIIGGLSVIWWDKSHRIKIAKENQTILELQEQNDLLREQLSKNATPSIAGESSEDQSNKIDLNTADTTELDKLPNIGQVRAADIVNYREANGGFQSVEELKNVKGIGDKTFEELKDLVTVGEH